MNLVKMRYQNYNSVEIVDRGGENLVIKRFNDRFCFENEFRSAGLLADLGMPVPEVKGVGDLEITYSYFDMPLFSKILKEDPSQINPLLEFLIKFQALDVRGFHIFTDAREKLLRVSGELGSSGGLDREVFRRVERLAGRYSPPCKKLVHGDFRPPNVFYREGVGGVIDFEFTGVEDPNRDFAYLWVGAMCVDKRFNYLLKEAFAGFNDFDARSFLFWLTYMHVMIISNPNNKDKRGWSNNLCSILREV